MQERLTVKITGLEEELFVLRNERSSNNAVVPASNQADRQCCSINRMPSSCADLKLIGHVLSGFYTVKGNGVLNSVYCDFTKSVNGTGMYNVYYIKLIMRC